jgi:hypothetical protein
MHHKRLSDLFAMVDRGDPRRHLQDAAKTLKEDIRVDMDWGRAASRRDTLSSEEEEAFSAIWAAGCHLSFATNSVPKKSTWHPDIYEAMVDLSDYDA